MQTKLLALLCGIVGFSYGDAISSQSNLNAILAGGTETTETFGGFAVSSGTATPLDCATLSSASTCNGQGPGLVAAGVTFSFDGGGGQWDGSGFLGSTSQEILSGAPSNPALTITFTSPVTAFGVDMRAFPTAPATALVTIYADDDVTVLGTISGIDLTSTLAFEGWQNNGGIGMVTLTDDQSWSPVLDSLEFGDQVLPPVPEPSPAVLLGLGLFGLAFRRRAAHVRARLWK